MCNHRGRSYEVGTFHFLSNFMSLSSIARSTVTFQAVYHKPRKANMETITIYSFLISSHSHDLSPFSLSMQCIISKRQSAPNAIAKYSSYPSSCQHPYFTSFKKFCWLLIAIFVPSLCTPHPSFHFVCPFITISRRYL